jgi:hypothetical protein
MAKAISVLEQNQFTAWRKRNLTIMGKILIIKTLTLPKFTFLASSCVVPKLYIKEIESCFYRFSTQQFIISL